MLDVHVRSVVINSVAMLIRIDEFCIQNDEYFINIDGFCIKNDELMRTSRQLSG